MNRIYKTVWNEKTRTFVAVSELTSARGKRSGSSSVGNGMASSSARSRGALALGAVVLSGAGLLGASVPALASVTVGDSEAVTGNSIIFSGGAGSINLNSGTISGLTASSITANGTNAVTTGQLYTTTQALATVTSRVSINEGSIGANRADIDALQTVTSTAVSYDSIDKDVISLQGASGTRITNLANGAVAANSKDAVTGGQLYDLEQQLYHEGSGVKYFNANTSLSTVDSAATGEGSIAIGPEAVSAGETSLAAGFDASTTETAVGAIALGHGATAGGDTSGAGTIAIGRASQALGSSTVVLGDAAKVDHENITGAVAIGKGATVSGQDSTGAIALGQSAAASAGNATALGAGADASGIGAIALGGATAGGFQSIAAGVGAIAATSDSIALGSNAGLGSDAEINDPGQRHSFIAIGKNAGQNIDGNEAIAIGVSAGSNTTKSQQIAIGTEAGTHLDGERNVSLGYQANKYDAQQDIRHAIAIGGLTKAMTEAVAIGYGAAASSNSVALGAGARADDESIALGANSHAVQVSGSSYLTGQDFNGPSVSVGNAVTGLTRRITNVEDGADDYDAVNVNQLRELKDSLGSFDPESGGNVNYNSNGTISVTAGTDDISAVNLGQMNTAIAAEKRKFYSINLNGDTANQNGDGALGADSANSMAIGHAAKVETAQRATAVGYSVLVKANDGTVLGSGSTVDDVAGVAIGHKAYSRGDNSVAIGTDAETESQGTGTTSNNAVAIGTSSRATNNSASALGHHATASGGRSSALGYSADASGVSALAFGTESTASGNDSQASGTNAAATRTNAQASGTEAKAYATDAIAIGTGATSGQAGPSPADQAGNIDTIAIGHGSLAIRTNAFASGTGAQATAMDAMAMGTNSVASAQNAVAIGRGATAGNTRSVALGDGASTDSAVGTTSATLNNLTYGNFAGNNPIATVSVGTAAEKRTITNVAAGRISGNSTDAINGSQLYATNAVLGNVANSTRTILGGNATLNGNGTITMSDVGGTGENTVHDAIEYAAQGWNVGANGQATTANVAPGGSVDLSNNDGNVNIARSGTSLTFNLDDEINVGSSINIGAPNNRTTINGGDVATNNLTVGGITRLGDQFVVNADNSVTYNGSEIANQTDGLSFRGNTGGNIAKTLGDTTPLTISGQLAADDQSTGANLRVDSDGNQLNLVMARNLTNLDSITISNGGPVISSGGINMSGKRITSLAPGVDGTDAVNLEQLEVVEAVANAGWNVTDGTNINNIGPDGQVTFAGDNNITVTESGVDDAGVITVALNESIDLGAAGSVTTGNSVLDTDGLVINDQTVNPTATTIVEAGTITLWANPTAAAANTIVIDANAGTIGGLTNTTFDPGNFTSGQAATEDQLKSVSDVANAGWNVTDGTNSNNIGPDGQVTFAGDNNITVTESGVDDAGVITVALNESIDLGAAGRVTIGDSELNNAGLTVDDGAGNSTETTVSGTTVTNVAGDTTTVGAGLISVADASGTTSIAGNQISIGGANPITISGATGTIGGLTNKTFNPDSFTSGQAATEDQLKSVSDVANAGWNVTDGTNSNNIGPDGQVTFTGGDNITVTESGVDDAGVITVALNESIDLGAAGSVTTGNTVMDNAGLTINDTTAETLTSIGSGAIALADNNGNLTTLDPTSVMVGGSSPIAISGDTGDITGLQNQTINYTGFATAGRAATEEQLEIVNEVANAGWNVTDGAASANIGPNGQVTFTGDSNVTVTQTGADQAGVVKIALNETIDLGATGSVTIGDSELNNAGLTVDDGAGNSTETTVSGTTVTNVAGDTTRVGAGLISVVDASGTTSIAGNQISIGGANPITISGAAGTIGGLTNKTFNPDSFTSGQAATEDQLKSVSDVANAGWNVTDGTNSNNIGPNGQVTFTGGDNITVTESGVDDAGVITVALNESIDLGAAGSVTTGNSVLDTKGLVIDNDDNNSTATTTVNAGTITLWANPTVGAANTIVIDAGAGTIGGLSNTTFDPDATYTGGLAATQEQLTQVNTDLTDKGLDFVGDDGQVVHRDLGEQLALTGGATGALTTGNIGVTQDGAGGLKIQLAQNINLGDAGSVEMGDTTVNNAGLTVDDGDNTTTVAAGTVDVTDANGTTTIAGNQVSVGGKHPVVINGDAGTIGGLTNTTFDPDATYTGGLAATQEQLTQVNTDLTDKGLDFVGDDGQVVHRDLGEQLALTGGATGALTTGNIGVTQDGAGGLKIQLAQNINLGDAGSITTGNSLLDTNGLVVNDDTGNPTATTTVDAGTITLWANPTAGGENTIVIDAGAGTIGGLSNTTFDSDATYTGGLAATQEQLTQVNTDLTDKGLDFVGDDGQVVHRDLGEQLALTGGATGALSTGNIGVTQDGAGGLKIQLAQNINLGDAGSVEMGDTTVNNAGLTVDDGSNRTVTSATGTTVTDGTNTTAMTTAGLTVDDGAGNSTKTTVSGTTVTNVAGDTTTVGAGLISVADASGTTSIAGNQISIGGANPITISGAAGTIRGLTNKTFNPDSFTSGQAATEDQLKSVSDVANAGWNVTDGTNSNNIGPDGQVTFAGDNNITVTESGVDDAGVITVALNESIDLGAAGRVTTGNTVMDNAGLTINDTTAETLTSIGSGAIALADNNGNLTTLDPTSVMVGGSSPIAISGDTGHITGLHNKTVNYPGFATAGRAATEEQLAPISNFVALNNDGTFSYNGQNHPTLQAALDSISWNVEVPAPDNSGGGSDGSGGSGGTGDTGGGTDGSGSGGTGDSSTPISNSNTVGFAAGDNIVISKADRASGAGADIKVSMADDISVSSITAVQVNAGQVNADRIEINNGGPVIDAKGIDMAGKPITNVAAGENETDAVNVGQLQQAAGNLQNQVNDLRRQDKRLSGGVAAAMATAALPQAYLPGKTMMSMAAGTWNSESGMAIGFSGISDNGHWVYKLSGNTTSRGDYGGAVGVGYQW